MIRRRRVYELPEDPEVLDWWALSPAQRFRESTKLWCALEDLVQAKKTQRDRDWPIVRRLLEADYHHHATRPSQKKIAFWMREVRTSGLLIELCHRYPGTARRMPTMRSGIRHQGGVRREVQQRPARGDDEQTADFRAWRRSPRLAC
jgi:hypothetical protein